MRSYYYRYSDYLKEKYGEKVYKLPINIRVTCPNRDGVLSDKGCFFCDQMATGFENLSSDLSVVEQLKINKEYIGKRYGANKFIAYFQNFTNTYLPLEELLKHVEEALSIENIVELTLSTRPDCISFNYLQELQKTINTQDKVIRLSMELGLQTVNYHTLGAINRGHTLAEFINAVLLAKEFQVEVGVHLILDLPGDNMIDVVENAKILSALDINNVKLHALYIRENTVFADRYKRGELPIISLDEYVDRVIEFLEYLNPKIAVQRLLGRVPEEGTLHANWNYSWWKIYDMIIKEMDRRDTYQGKKYNYLDGKALCKFLS